MKVDFAANYDLNNGNLSFCAIVNFTLLETRLIITYQISSKPFMHSKFCFYIYCYNNYEKLTISFKIGTKLFKPNSLPTFSKVIISGRV